MDAFFESYRNLHEAQMRRLSTTKNATVVMQLTQELHAADCLPENVRDKCWDELSRVCLKKYSTSMASSTRFEGFGWSSAHIDDHMQRFLKEIMERRAQIFRKYIS